MDQLRHEFLLVIGILIIYEIPRTSAQFTSCETHYDCDRSTEFCDKVMWNCQKCASQPCSASVIGKDGKGDGWCRTICPVYWQAKINSTNQVTSPKSENYPTPANANVTSTQKDDQSQLSKGSPLITKILLFMVISIICVLVVLAGVFLVKNIKKKRDEWRALRRTKQETIALEETGNVMEAEYVDPTHAQEVSKAVKETGVGRTAQQAI